jgi:3',5'-cyclic AMP phosphodiesterase CpdA
MRWLHISDIHYDQEPGMKSDMIREGLENLEYWANERVDEIFVTGDFHHAGKAEKADAARRADAAAAVEFLIKIAKKVIPERIQKTDPLAKHIHIVPGNHDLTRESGAMDLNALWTRYNESASCGKWSLSAEDKEYLVNRFVFFKEVMDQLWIQGGPVSEETKREGEADESMNPADQSARTASLSNGMEVHAGGHLEGRVWNEDDMLNLHTMRYLKPYNICIVYLNTAIACGLDR